MLALPYCRPGGSVDWDGGGAEGASAIGSEEEAPPDCVARRSWGGWGPAKHVRHRPRGLWLRPPSNPRGGSSPRLSAVAQGS